MIYYRFLKYTRCFLTARTSPNGHLFSFSSNDSQQKKRVPTTMAEKKTGKSSFVKEELIASGKWLQLSNITYTDPTGKERLWETVGRTTKQSAAIADAVCSIPIFKRLLHYDSIILVKQYRPPMKAYTLEFPAGLVDPGETPETCALRELKEETGLTGIVKHTSPATALDPGVGGSTVQFVTVEIDGDLPENKSPTHEPAEGEFIEVLTVPLDELLKNLNEFSSQGFVIDSRVYSYAVAREQMKQVTPSV